MPKQNGPITADLRDTNAARKCFSKLLRVCSCRAATELSHRAMCSCTTCSTPPPPKKKKKWGRHDSKLFSFSFIFNTQCLIDASNSVFFLPAVSYTFLISLVGIFCYVYVLASFNRFCTGSVNVKEHSGQKYN